MKKTIKITFIDGTTQQLDANKAVDVLGSLMMLKQANDPIWLSALQQIANQGVIDDDTRENYAKYIAPSQIKFVELFFENSQTLKIEKS